MDDFRDAAKRHLDDARWRFAQRHRHRQTTRLAYKIGRHGGISTQKKP
ncbi:hypothetical protein [Verminephrobacter eiseniae]|nr:hypothetical protein [Verminephrobacter eiseniae]